MSPELVKAALDAAEELGKDVADVPVTAIAAEAGSSRSTLLRRLGGSRAALDAAVRAAGIDTGGPPLCASALDAAGNLISQFGLAAATLEAIAAHSQCSVYSLHAAFGGRDGSEAFWRPKSPAAQSLFGYTVPRMFGVLGRWLEAEIRTGHIRTPGLALPDIDTLCDVFADAFIRAARRLDP